MIVSSEYYKEMHAFVVRAIADDRTISIADCIAYNYDFNVIYSIYNRVMVRVFKKEIKHPRYEQQYAGSSVTPPPPHLTDDYASLSIKVIADASITSPENNLIKESLGLEYEEILIKRLTDLKMCFETESQQRRRGKPKTPDILFHIPIAVKNSTSQSPVVVNWIDSKALFADDSTYLEHAEQLKGYNNRYGRGMVIYWYGFTESILALVREDGDMIAVTDSFPLEILSPTTENGY